MKKIRISLTLRQLLKLGKDRTLEDIMEVVGKKNVQVVEKAEKSVVEKAQNLERIVERQTDELQQLGEGQKKAVEKIERLEEVSKEQAEQTTWIQKTLIKLPEPIQGILKSIGILDAKVSELKEQQAMSHAAIEKKQEEFENRIQQKLSGLDEIGANTQVIMALLSRRNLGAQKLLRLEKAIDLAKDNYREGSITAEEIAEYLLAELLEIDNG